MCKYPTKKYLYLSLICLFVIYLYHWGFILFWVMIQNYIIHCYCHCSRFGYWRKFRFALVFM